jgi:hypothetical protein
MGPSDCDESLEVPLSMQPRQAATAHVYVSHSLNRAHTYRATQVSSNAQSVTLKASTGLKPGMTYTWGARVYLSTAPDTPTDFCTATVGKTSLLRLALLICHPTQCRLLHLYPHKYSFTRRYCVSSSPRLHCFISTHTRIVSLAATVCHHHPDCIASSLPTQE